MRGFFSPILELPALSWGGGTRPGYRGRQRGRQRGERCGARDLVEEGQEKETSPTLWAPRLGLGRGKRGEGWRTPAGREPCPPPLSLLTGSLDTPIPLAVGPAGGGGWSGADVPGEVGVLWRAG